VATTIYTTAAQLGYAMHDPDVVAIDDRHDQYDLWFDPAAHIGESALVVADSRQSVDYVRRYFDTLQPLEYVPFERFGMVIYRPRIYLARGFLAPSDKLIRQRCLWVNGMFARFALQPCA
jgi:hypothetical protein